MTKAMSGSSSVGVGGVLPVGESASWRWKRVPSSSSRQQDSFHSMLLVYKPVLVTNCFFSLAIRSHTPSA